MKQPSLFLSILCAFFAISSSSRAYGDLIGYWNFDEGAGTVARDSSAYGNNGTLVGGAWAAGKYGNAIDFTPSTSTQVRITDTPSLYTPSSLTVMAWVNVRDLSRDAPIFAQEGNGGLAINLQHNNGSLGILLEKGDDGESGYSWDLVGYQASGMTQSTWTHLAATWDGNTVRTYKNGQLMPNSYSFTGTLTNSSDILTIGVNSAWNTTRFDGLIDEVRLYNNALTQSEIQSLMAVPEPTSSLLVTAGVLCMLGVKFRTTRRRADPNNTGC